MREMTEEIKEAFRTIIRHAVEDGISEDKGMAVMAPKMEIDGKTVGPFEIHVNVLNHAADGEAELGVAARLTEDTPAEASKRGNCVICDYVVAFSDGFPDVPIICLTCMMEHGSERAAELALGTEQVRN